MKKYTICLVSSVILFIIALLSLIGAITVTGSGFLDLSNIARGIFTVVALVSFILAAIVFPKEKIDAKKLTCIIIVICVLVILFGTCFVGSYFLEQNHPPVPVIETMN